MPKEFKFLFKPFLLFIFLFSVLFSQDDCNDSLALNYNANSNDSNECVYVNNINSFVSDEDSIAEKDLTQNFSGYSNYFDNISLTVNCSNVQGIADCNINDENLEYIQKTVFSDGTKKYGQIKDEYYNIRLNLKREIPLHNRHHFVKSMLVDYRNKGKHFRYKKRYSFLTEDKVFRIDLTVVKETTKYKGKFNFKKTFKEADILKNKEKYEVEIEYVGWEKEVGIPKIDLLYRQLKDKIDPYFPGNQNNGNIYDPLNLGINIPKQGNFNKDYDYDYDYRIDSPTPRERFDDDVNTKLISYNDSSIKYTYDDYRTLLGKFTRIKDSYFNENDIDPLFGEALKGYYRLGTKIGLIEDIFEEINEETNEYIDTKVLVSFTPMIGNIKDLIVPIKDLYDGYFTIKEKSIVEGAVINKTFEPISDLFEIPSFHTFLLE